MHSTKVLTGLVLLVVLSTGLTSCGSKDGGLETDWYVVVGSMRGVLGAGNGYRIHGDGQIESWTSVTDDGEFDIQKVGVAGNPDLGALYAMMQNPTLRDVPGGMGELATDFLEWHGPDTTWRCIWDPNAIPDRSVQNAFETAMSLVHDVVQGKGGR